MSIKPEFGRKITPEPKPLILVQEPTETKILYRTPARN